MHHTTTLTTLAAAAALVAGPLALTTTTAQAAGTSERRAAATYTVTARVNKAVVTVGEDVVKVRGKVTPRAAGDKVVLQQRLDGKRKWSVSGSTRIRANGTFLAKDRPSVAGTRQYRVVKPASDGIRKGTSNVVEVLVYKWQRLAQRPRGANDNANTGGTALIGTQAYPSSIQPYTAGTPAYVEYTLGRLCTDLRATYALTDSSATGATGRVRLLLDGVVKVDQALAVADVVESTTDLTNAFRLRYEFTSSATPAGYPAAATPEVRCTA